jgi:HEAT repeat protein
LEEFFPRFGKNGRKSSKVWKNNGMDRTERSIVDRQFEKQRKERAVELGKSGDPAALPELIELTRFPAPSVRKLAASAIGKLAGLVTDSNAAVQALQLLLQDHFPQARQYAAKALSAYGGAAQSALPDLRDMAISPVEPQYNNNPDLLVSRRDVRGSPQAEPNA